MIRTADVERRTTALLVRFRYHIVTTNGGVERALLAEDCQVLAFAGAPQNAEWLDVVAAEPLLTAQPDGNIGPDQATNALERILEGYDALRTHLDEADRLRGAELLDAHRRVRAAARTRGVSYRVEPQSPPDVLGVYVYLPNA